MIAVDETFLSLIFYPDAIPPEDPNTHRPITRLKERIDFLVEGWQAARETITVPTPVITEFLYLAGDRASDYLSELENNSVFKSADFDKLAAVELAALHNKFGATKAKRKRRSKGKDETWAKINFDRQIVAICKTKGVKTIYSDDGGLRTFAERNGIDVISTWEIPEPPADAQMTLDEMIEREQATTATDEGELMPKLKQGRKFALGEEEV